MTLLSLAPQIARDGFGRPKIIPPGNPDGKPVAYTRTTTFVGACEDTYKLSQWSQRHAVKGAAHHEDLLTGVRETDLDDKDGMNFLVDEAKLRAGASDQAEHGTYLHDVTEVYDRGLDPATVPRPLMHARPQLGAQDYLPDLAAYVEATKDFKHLHIEQMTVHDPWKVAGTPDRIVSFQGKRYIADLKSGNIEYGAGKIAAQLAMYARSQLYDIGTGARAIHGAELDRGIVIHLPAGTGTCEVLWIDLLAGWEVAKTCRDVRERRRLSARNLYAPLQTAPLVNARDLRNEIQSCTSRAEVETLWRTYENFWTGDMTSIAKAHLATLGGAS